MSNKNYSDKLLDPRWQKKRLEILQRDSFKCRLCDDGESTLHVHHDSYKGNPWDIDPIELKTVCKYCHAIIHNIINEYKGTVLHIEKVSHQYDFEVYIKIDGKLGIAFYEKTTFGKVPVEMKVCFLKSAIDRYNSILKSF